MDEIAALVEPHIPGLRRYAYALLRDGASADDLVQDCLERVVSRWHLRRADGDLRAWLFTILRNLYISGLRHHRRRSPHTSLDDLAVPPATDGSQEAHVMIRDVLDGIDAMTEEHRTLILLVGVEELSYEEAAKVTGLPIGTVMSRLSRARERLRAYMDTGARPGLRRVK